MKARGTHKLAMAMVAGLALWLLPMMATGQEYWWMLKDDGMWLDGITKEVKTAQATEEGLQPYLGQLMVVRTARGDDTTTYVAMNRFMDMLETRAHAIRPETADRIFDFCYLATPAKYHDVTRHAAYHDRVDRWLGENGFGTSGG